ncbi:MAG: DUF5103 domain-containing protein [Bacteroidales bacterium]|nr:DUF5103 domain-containing protein [Bacteroidales bacterium]
MMLSPIKRKIKNCGRVCRLVLGSLLLILFSSLVTAQTYYTHPISNEVNSLIVFPDGAPLEAPIIALEGGTIVIKFDDMTYGNSNYSYKVVHCNADWTPSELASAEYLRGFQENSFDYGTTSQLTTVPYTHYEVRLPNNDVALTISGNYAVLIAKDYDYDNPAAVACFSIVEPMVTISGEVSGNTPLGISTHYQMVNFEIDHQNYTVRDPQREFRVVVMQNRRTDNMVINPRPNYTTFSKETYRDNRALVFEGGNEYRTIDFSSEYTYGAGINRIEALNNVMHVDLISATPRTPYATPTSGGDADGRMVINRQHSDDVDIEADYMWVHFFLETNYLPNGSVYLLGDLTGNRLDPLSQMTYQQTPTGNGYACSLYLKQGGYSFQYAFLPKGKTQASLLPIEGSYWNTENEYIILVYHRGFGQRYDRLVGYQIIQ